MTSPSSCQEPDIHCHKKENDVTIYNQYVTSNTSNVHTRENFSLAKFVHKDRKTLFK